MEEGDKAFRTGRRRGSTSRPRGRSSRRGAPRAPGSPWFRTLCQFRGRKRRLLCKTQSPQASSNRRRQAVSSQAENILIKLRWVVENYFDLVILFEYWKIIMHSKLFF
jgi:hypothetical protein